MASELTSQTEAAIAQHFYAVENANPDDAASIEEIVSGYAQDARLFTPNGVFTGHAEVRTFYQDFIQNMPPGMPEALQVDKQEVRDGICYMLWSARPFVPFGAETVIVRDGKIAVHTFGPFMQG